MTFDPMAVFGEIANFINDATGHPVCALGCEHGGVCTLDTDHEGDHESHGLSGGPLCSWPREVTV